jgi:hypothetical protein
LWRLKVPPLLRLLRLLRLLCLRTESLGHAHALRLQMSHVLLSDLLLQVGRQVLKVGHTRHTWHTLQSRHLLSLLWLGLLLLSWRRSSWRLKSKHWLCGVLPRCGALPLQL